MPLSSPQQEDHIPSMFQTLQLPDFEKQLKLIVDSPYPLTFVNSKTWHDLDKPRLQSTTKVLGAFEGQPINPLGYFEARVVREDDSNKSAVIKMHVSQNGINILGCDGKTKLSVSIDPTKLGSFSGRAILTQNSPGCNWHECRAFSPVLGHCVTTKSYFISQ